MPRSRNVAPRLSTCSLTTGRTSKPDTTAPRRRAVAIACSPATPAPMTSTLAGTTVPAAVTSIGRNFGSRSAARRMALYPETVAWEESASIDWARVMRGIDSMAKAVTPREALDSFPVGERLQEPDQDLPVAQLAHLVVARFSHFGDELRGPRIADRGAGVGERGVGERGGLARALLDDDLDSVELGNERRHERNSPLPGRSLPGHANLHGRRTLSVRFFPIRVDRSVPTAAEQAPRPDGGIASDASAEGGNRAPSLNGPVRWEALRHSRLRSKPATRMRGVIRRASRCSRRRWRAACAS